MDKKSKELEKFLCSDDVGLVRMGLSMAETMNLSDDALSIIFNMSVEYDLLIRNDRWSEKKGIWEEFLESSTNLASTDKRYGKFMEFVKEFEGTFSTYSLLIDWALKRHTNRETAVSLLKKIDGNSVYTDYLVSCLKRAYLDFDGGYCRGLMGDIWDAGEAAHDKSREKEVFDVITKKAEDGQTYGLDPFDYLVDSIYEAFDVYLDTCKIMVEVLMTITNSQADRSLKLLENLLEEKGGDSPIYGQMENAIVILSGGKGKAWNSFGLNFGIYL